MKLIQSDYKVYDTGMRVEEKLKDDRHRGYKIIVQTSDGVSTKGYTYTFLTNKDKTKAKIIGKQKRYGKYNEKTNIHNPDKSEITETVKDLLKKKKGIKQFYGKNEKNKDIPKDSEISHI